MTLSTFDLSIQGIIPHSPIFTKTMLWITAIGSWKIVLCMMILVSTLCWFNRNRTLLIPFLVCVSGAEITVEILKFLIRRPRPPGASYLETFYSFPSGHSADAVALYGFIAFILLKRSKSSLEKVVILAVAFLIILLIGISRIYLGVHYPSDVLGGYLIGAIWLAVSTCLFNRSKRNKN